MHSSRMRTIHSSSHVYPCRHWVGVYPSMHWTGGCIPACTGGGVCPVGVYPSMHWVGVYPSMHWASSRSSGQVRGARNMKSMWPPLATIFYNDLFSQGGAWPPHPPRSATAGQTLPPVDIMTRQV